MNSLGDLSGPAEAAFVEIQCPGCRAKRKVHPRAAERVNSRCQECADAAFERERAEAEENEALRRERERARFRESIRADVPAALRGVGTPARYAEFTREAWEAEYGPWKDHEKFRELVGWPKSSPLVGTEPQRDWLVMLEGRYGRRKTGLATAILGEALARGFESCRWEDMNTWLRLLRVQDFANYDRVWWRAARASVLVFDDVGAIKGARIGSRRGNQDWWGEEVSELLRYRHMEALPTVVTTNGSVEDLGGIDRSLPSRMKVRLAWPMGGPDFRKGSLRR